MKWKFVNKENTGRLILIFAGWSTDATFYADIRIKGWDTLVVWDYSNFEFDENLLDDYHTVALFAWSLGVYAASRSLPFEKISLAVAINGTESPVDDLLGIPSTIYHSTLSTLNERNLLKFRKRMAGKAYESIAKLFPTVDIETLRHELEIIANDFSSRCHREEGGKWHKVFISEEDRIFPPHSQQRAWSTHSSCPTISMLPTPHYTDILTIIRTLLPEKERVGARFEKSHQTYDSQATAQYNIAEELAATTADIFENKDLGKVAEIGPGTGLFTREFCRYFTPDEMEFVDLYSLPKFGVAPRENYYQADAEEWMAEKVATQAGTYDAIVGASVMQWFANPERFIANASLLLKPKGFIAFSTFLPGNLSELENVNPYSLPYRGREEIENMVRKRFRTTFFFDEEIRLDFQGSREVLSHIRRTGVGGVGKSGLQIKELLDRLSPTLTYHPLYIVATFPKHNKHQS